MLEKGRISSLQMAIMMYTTVMATAILIVPAITNREAGQDAWLSPIIASFAGVIVILVAYSLHKLYPTKTPIEYSEEILGSIFGKFIGLIILFYFLNGSGMIVREYGDFVVGSFLRQTPVIVVMASIVIVGGMAVRAGIEPIGRANEFFVPFHLLIIFLLIVLVMPEFDYANLLPVFENGIQPAIKGAWVPQAWFCQFFIIAFLLPVTVDNDKALKKSFMSLIFITITLVLTNLAAILLFGQLSAKLTYPVMSAARYVRLADFFEHVESLVMALWVVGVFLKISTFYYVLVISTAHFLHLTNYKPIVFPVGIVILTFSVWGIPTQVDTIEVLSKVTPIHAVVSMLFVPVLLLTVALLKKKIFPKNKKSTGI